MFVIDAAGNYSSGSTAILTVDNTPPTIVITASGSSVNSGATSALTFTLSESSVDFTSADVDVVGGSISGFAGSGTGYTATFTPTVSSTTTGTIDVQLSKFTDTAGNNNTAATQVSISVDTLAPTVAIVATPTSVNSGSTSTIAFTLSESSVNFDDTDLTVTGGVISGFAGAGTSYTATFTPTASSTANGTIDIVGGAFTDAAGNSSTIATQNVISVDTVSPYVSSITLSDTALKVGDTAIVTITLSEAASGATFTDADVTVIENGTLSPITTADNITYT